MRPLDLQSEQYSATGNVASEGVLNQLGRPNLDMLTVLVRETVQNSWDARSVEGSGVRFGMFGKTLTDEQMHLLQQVIFANHSSYPSLSNALSSGINFQVLGVYDRGTTGLGGPTRADQILDETEPRNFVNFLRNVGLPPDKHLGGGTFGYGKAALYLASSIRTICIHTHCFSRNEQESRFMVAALGSRYEMQDFNKKRYQYTGRHWWGRDEDGVVEPVRGSDADDLAQYLGFPKFVDGECGTTILILLPVLGEHSLLQTLRLAGTHILWNCWPKMCSFGQDKPSMTFELSYEGQFISIPDPHDFPPLQGFAQAMENLKNQLGASEDSILSQLIPIECYSPKQRLGLLSLQRFPVEERLDLLTNGEKVFPFGGSSHHVALMRRPELVVRYIPGPPLPSSQIEYAGVFVVDEQVDHVFAKAEPPTHDDWAFQSLEDTREKTFVRMALRRIQEVLHSFTLSTSISSKGASILPLGAFADRLGGLLLGSEGSGATVQPFRGKNGEIKAEISEKQDYKIKAGLSDYKTNTSTSSASQSRGPQKAKVSFLKTGTLGLVGGIPVLLTEFAVEHRPNSQGTMVQVETSAILDGNELEKDPPLGGQTPHILFWIAPDKSKHKGSSQMIIPTSSGNPWGVVISVPDDMIVSVNLTVSEEL